MNRKDKSCDLSKHPNAIKLAGMNKQTVKSMLIDLAVKTKQLTAKDLDYWRKAWQIAINYENPKRQRLLDTYDDAMIDNHLSGAIRNRKSKVLRKSFLWVDDSGKEDPELSKLFRKPWFKKFMSLALDATYYGHSLIQFGDIVNNAGKLAFTDIQLVRREHVVPEYHRVIRDTSDDWNKGYDYQVPPLSDWCIEVGDPTDLGLLLKVCPQAIAKKNMLAFWDKFGEIFGMPIRIGTSNSRNPNDISSIETMLEEMGAAAWGLFPEGTDIKIIETTRGDAYNVYDARIERANSEMSKAILGETMTMDNGSSRSQSEVHQDELEGIVKDDADALRDIINEKLIPFLILKGFKLDGKQFEWNNTIEFTPQEQLKIEKMLLDNYDVDFNYFVTKYAIPIKGVKTKQSAGPLNNFF